MFLVLKVVFVVFIQFIGVQWKHARMALIRPHHHLTLGPVQICKAIHTHTVYAQCLDTLEIYPQCLDTLEIQLQF